MVVITFAVGKLAASSGLQVVNDKDVLVALDSVVASLHHLAGSGSCSGSGSINAGAGTGRGGGGCSRLGGVHRARRLAEELDVASGLRTARPS
mmetsp:Transcript_4562/g.9873  ORF Transcript_4562/g.9873 Transcript_4562/m.9873 type:complete len:93 (-) Transcript_4562:275-553(-)